MDGASEAKKAKLVRQRKTPYRKWSEQEQRVLIDFLRDNKPIERPSAQIYYKKFLKQCNLEMDWSLVRCKVKNLKQSFIKAKAWQNSTGGGTTSDTATVRDAIAKIHPLFDELEEVFGYREFISNRLIIDTENSTTWDSLPDELNSTSNSDVFEICGEQPVVDDAAPSTIGAVQQATEGPEKPTSEASVNVSKTSASQPSVRKGINSRTALAEVLEIYASLVAMKKDKLEMDYDIRQQELSQKEREIELQEQKIKLQEQKFLQESAGKAAELQSKEKIKILELEMKERITMRKLEMKEKLKMEKIKKQMSKS